MFFGDRKWRSVLPPRLTVHRSVVPVGVDPPVGQNLDVFPAGAAVQLVGPSQPAAHAVRQAALLGDMVLEVRRGLHCVLKESTCHQMLHSFLMSPFFFFFF